MSEGTPPPGTGPGGRPDPWAVVEHHARQAAQQGGPDALSEGQRLALYVAAAPHLIGARRLDPAVLGHTIRRAGGDGAEWWAAPLPGEARDLAWSGTGVFAVQQPGRRRVMGFALGLLGFLLAFGAFGRLAGPRAAIPALIVGGALFLAGARMGSDWRLLDGGGANAGIRDAIARFVATYEEGVG